VKARHVRPRGKQGSALVLVFWCLLLLGMAVFAVVELVQLSVEHSANRELALEARALAASGVALGLDSQLLKDDPLFLHKPSPGRQFRVKIESEGARFNLNHLLLTGHRDVLAGLFTRWGLKIDEADHAADCLYDWVTPGDLRSLNGAKAIDYQRAGLPQKPSHQPFTSLDEAGQVMGMDRVAALKPDWQESFTLWSEGPLDINEAPAELIAALFGLDVARVEFFTEARNGRDGIPGTLDDVPVTAAAALQASLGIGNLQMKAMLNQVSFGDATRRIESTGQAGDSQVMISVVTRLNSSPPTYLLWSEP
jgi:type II secretory pathway component PulK